MQLTPAFRGTFSMLFCVKVSSVHEIDIILDSVSPLYLSPDKLSRADPRAEHRTKVKVRFIIKCAKSSSSKTVQ